MSTDAEISPKNTAIEDESLIHNPCSIEFSYKLAIICLVLHSFDNFRMRWILQVYCYRKPQNAMRKMRSEMFAGPRIEHESLKPRLKIPTRVNNSLFTELGVYFQWRCNE